MLNSSALKAEYFVLLSTGCLIVSRTSNKVPDAAVFLNQGCRLPWKFFLVNRPGLRSDYCVNFSPLLSKIPTEKKVLLKFYFRLITVYDLHLIAIYCEIST